MGIDPAGRDKGVVELWGMSSPNVAKVAIALEELDLPWRPRRVNVFAGEQFDPDFLAISPNGKVPVIVDPNGPGGAPLTIFESGAILVYLAEKCGRLLSADPVRRCGELQWLMVQMGTIGPMLGQWNHFQVLAPPGNDYSRQRYVTERGRILDMLERRLGDSPYLGGADYSIADIATFPWIRNTLGYGHPGVQPQTTLAPFPALRRWYVEIADRPAVRRLDADFAAARHADRQARSAATPDQIDRFVGRGRYSRS